MIKILIRESLFILIILGIVDLIAGATLFGMADELFHIIPGLIVVVPALINLRGCICSAMGSRLSSAIHLGTVTRSNFFASHEVKDNIKASVLLTVVLSCFIGFTAALSCVILNKPVNFFLVFIITTISGFIAGLILLCIAMMAILISFYRGVDPDNVVTPILATLGDLTTICCLFLIVTLTKFFVK